jgi:hypothetical protein
MRKGWGLRVWPPPSYARVDVTGPVPPSAIGSPYLRIVRSKSKVTGRH